MSFCYHHALSRPCPWLPVHALQALLRAAHHSTACRYENFDEWPYNDGVMLWNLPYMRRTNQAFVNWTLSQRNGLWFEGEAGTLCDWPVPPSAHRGMSI